MLEKQILGAALLDKQSAEKAVTSLTVEHFNKHREVFKAMQDLARQDKEIDVVSLSDKINIEALTSIASSVSTSAYIDTHIKQLQEKKYLRDLSQYSRELQERINKEDIEEIHKHLSSIPQMKEEENKHQDTESLLQEVINDVGKRMTAKDDIRGLRTGFYELDQLIGGLKPTEVIGVMADPNVGKSLLALNIACNVADRGNRVDFFAYEMSNKQIGYRMLPGLLNIEIKTFSNPKSYMKPQDIKQIENFKNHNIFKNLHVYADELTMNTVTEIKTKINQATMKCNKKIDLLIVDYLQLLEGDNEDWENAGKNLKLLKGLAKHYKIPVIIIVSKAKDGTVRGSGQIEFDMDQKWDIKRDHEAETAIERSATELIVRKNRDGGKGKINLIYDDRYLVFRMGARNGY